VALADVQAEDGERLRAESEAVGGQALSVDCDGSDAAAVEQAIAARVECFGRLDIVVADAGITSVWTPVEELRPDEWINPLYSAVLPHRLIVL